MPCSIAVFFALFLALALQTLASAIQPIAPRNLSRTEEARSTRLDPRQPAIHNPLYDHIGDPQWALKNCERIGDYEVMCPPGDRLVEGLVDQTGCYPIPAGKFPDAHAKKVFDAAMTFCNNTIMNHQHDKRPIRPVRNINVDASLKDFHHFKMEVTEDTGCDTELEHLDLLHPKNVALGGRDNLEFDCVSIFYWAWRGCTGNAGRGGWVKSHCLKYSIRAPNA